MSAKLALTYRPTRWPWLEATREDGQLWLYDPRRIAGPPIPVSTLELEAINLFTGLMTIQQIHSSLSSRFGLATPTLDALTAFVERLDRDCYLDGKVFQDYVNGPVRRPSCIGCYPLEPVEIVRQLNGLFTATGGPGLPSNKPSPSKKLRAILAPHIDYTRGGMTYGYAFKELAEQTNARIFVIIGTSHYSACRFTLTRMNFVTPLGWVETDQSYIDRLVESYGDGLFDDRLAHLPEHSIELEVVMLQHMFANQSFRIVPLLVGSFMDCLSSGTKPEREVSIARMAAALAQVEAAFGEPVCYVISGDLAHIGPKFGDPELLNDVILEQSRKCDENILQSLVQVDHDAYFNQLAAEEDARRICGFPPTYLTLSAIRPSSGCILHYQQHVHPQGLESVSFAAAAFYD